jgi:hypothetical protein
MELQGSMADKSKDDPEMHTGQIPDNVRTATGLIHGQREVDPERVTGWWQERAQRYEAPATWTIGHVDRRLVQGFEVLFRLPMRIAPKQFGTAMPAYIHEWSDYVAQSEGERDLKRARNRLIYRHKGATADEVAAMEQALAWPMVHLGDDTEASRAVLLGSMWKALELEIDRRVTKLGMSRRTFFRNRKRGLDSLVAGLIAARVVVT